MRLSIEHLEYLHRKIYRVERLLDQAVNRHYGQLTTNDPELFSPTGWVSLALTEATHARSYGDYLLEMIPVPDLEEEPDGSSED